MRLETAEEGSCLEVNTGEGSTGRVVNIRPLQKCPSIDKVQRSLSHNPSDTLIDLYETTGVKRSHSPVICFRAVEYCHRRSLNLPRVQTTWNTNGPTLR